MKLLRAIDRFIKWLLAPSPAPEYNDASFPDWAVALACLMFATLTTILTLAALTP